MRFKFKIILAALTLTTFAALLIIPSGNQYRFEILKKDFLSLDINPYTLNKNEQLDTGIVYKPYTKVLVFGDTILLDPLGSSLVDKTFNPFQNLLEKFKEYDFIVGNQEGTIDGESVGKPNPGKPYTFSTPKESVRAYLEAGIDAFSYANNHARDYGPESVMHTIQLLNDVGIGTFGAGANTTEAFKPLNVDLYGNKLAFLSYNCAEYLFNRADDNTAGTAFFNESLVRNSISTAKLNSDIVIVMSHCGIENTKEPSDWQIQWAKIMTLAGADILIGGHPHVRQYDTTVNGKPVIYSIGNFMIPGQSSTEEKRRGWMVEIVIKDKKIESYKLIEIRMDDIGMPWLVE